MEGRDMVIRQQLRLRVLLKGCDVATVDMSPVLSGSGRARVRQAPRGKGYGSTVESAMLYTRPSAVVPRTAFCW